jgi:hypothetical protein
MRKLPGENTERKYRERKLPVKRKLPGENTGKSIESIGVYICIWRKY